MNGYRAGGVAAEMMQHVQGFGLSPYGKLQAMQTPQRLILGIGQELDRSRRQGDRGLKAVARQASQIMQPVM